MRETEKVMVRARDLAEASRFILDNLTSEVLLIVKDNKFCLQSRTEYKEVIWTSDWSHTLNKSDDCVYGFSASDFLKILSLALNNTDLGTDYVSFIFTKDRQLTRVATAESSLWFDYAYKIS
jgi:hypothetical protein